MSKVQNSRADHQHDDDTISNHTQNGILENLMGRGLTSTPLRPTPRNQSVFFSPGRTSRTSGGVRYSLSDNSFITPTQQNASPKAAHKINGPLLASTQFNINLGTYTDSRSPGLSSRIVQYDKETTEKQIPTHQAKYNSPGVFPIVHFFQKTPPVVNPKPVKRVTVRIPHLESSAYDSFQVTRYSGDFESDTKKDSTESSRRSKSVLDALKEISKNRIRTSENVELNKETENLHITNDVAKVGETNKRVREESPPHSCSDNDAVVKSPRKKKICVVDMISASYTSSNLLLSKIKKGLKRKIEIEDCSELEKKQTKFTTSQTQTVQNYAHMKNKGEQTDPKDIVTDKPKKSTSANTSDVVSNVHTIESNGSIGKEDQLKWAKGKKQKLELFLLNLTGQKIECCTDEQNNSETNLKEKKLVSILSPHNKPKHDKHVTFDIPTTSTSESAVKNNIALNTTVPVTGNDLTTHSTSMPITSNITSSDLTTNSPFKTSISTASTSASSILGVIKTSTAHKSQGSFLPPSTSCTESIKPITLSNIVLTNSPKTTEASVSIGSLTNSTSMTETPTKSGGFMFDIKKTSDSKQAETEAKTASGEASSIFGSVKSNTEETTNNSEGGDNNKVLGVMSSNYKDANKTLGSFKFGTSPTTTTTSSVDVFSTGTTQSSSKMLFVSPSAKTNHSDSSLTTGVSGFKQGVSEKSSSPYTFPLFTSPKTTSAFPVTTSHTSSSVFGTNTVVTTAPVFNFGSATSGVLTNAISNSSNKKVDSDVMPPPFATKTSGPSFVFGATTVQSFGTLSTTKSFGVTAPATMPSFNSTSSLAAPIFNTKSSITTPSFGTVASSTFGLNTKTTSAVFSPTMSTFATVKTNTPVTTTIFGTNSNIGSTFGSVLPTGTSPFATTATMPSSFKADVLKTTQSNTFGHTTPAFGSTNTIPQFGSTTTISQFGATTITSTGSTGLNIFGNQNVFSSTTTFPNTFSTAVCSSTPMFGTNSTVMNANQLPGTTIASNSFSNAYKSNLFEPDNKTPVTSAPGAFGAPPFGNPVASGGFSFNVITTTSSNNVFGGGAQNNTPGFTGTTASSTFGTTSNLFESKFNPSGNQTGMVFNTNKTPISSASIFGSTSMAFDNQPQPSNVPPKTDTFVFGSTTVSKNNMPPFGSGATYSSPNPFGGPANKTAQPFGATGFSKPNAMFGSAPIGNAAPIFGNAPSGGATTQPSAIFSFGSSAPPPSSNVFAFGAGVSGDAKPFNFTTEPAPAAFTGGMDFGTHHVPNTNASSTFSIGSGNSGRAPRTQLRAKRRTQT